MRVMVQTMKVDLICSFGERERERERERRDGQKVSYSWKLQDCGAQAVFVGLIGNIYGCPLQYIHTPLFLLMDKNCRLKRPFSNLILTTISLSLSLSLSPVIKVQSFNSCGMIRSTLHVYMVYNCQNWEVKYLLTCLYFSK